MSNFILYKGNSDLFSINDFKVIKYPFENDYLKKASEYFWSNEEINEIWSVVDLQTAEVDSYFTNAQRQILQSNLFYNTELFKLLDKIISNVKEIVIWYSDYTEDIPIFPKRGLFLNAVKQQLLEPSCEVYARYINKNV